MKAPSKRILTSNSAGALLLKRINKVKKPVIAIDVVDALAATLLTKRTDYFEASWISSLGVSSKLGFPDVYNLSPRDYTELITDINVTSLETSLIVDADNGGQSYKNTAYAFQLYSTLGVAAAFVENKRGLKFNSVDPTASNNHKLEDKSIFAEKIRHAIDSQNNTLVGIRFEDGIVNDYDDDKAIKATMEAVEYFLKESKPDFFLFHWKKESSDVPVQFAARYNTFLKANKIENPPLLACVPTTYSKNITNTKLYESGYHIIIYGNALLRSQASAIIDALKSIEKNDSLKELEQTLPPTKHILDIMEKKSL